MKIPRSYKRPHKIIRNYAFLKKNDIFTRHGTTNAEATHEEIRDMYIEQNRYNQLPVAELNRQQQISPIQSFFKKNAFWIKELSSKFVTYMNCDTPIDEKAIKEWLAQFDRLEWIQLAFRLLYNLEFYNSYRMKAMFKHFYDINMAKDQRKAVISLLGNPKDSSSIVNYVIGSIAMEQGIETQDLRTILDKMNPEEKKIVFVDDNIGSGKQAICIFKEWLGIQEKSLHEPFLLFRQASAQAYGQGLFPQLPTL